MVSTILVVEDNPNEQVVIKHLLPKFNYAALIVDSAEEALKVFQTMTFGAVLMDLTLPGFSGFSCTMQMRQLEAATNTHTPIIALTARTDRSARQKAIDVGMDAYVVKPFQIEELRLILKQYV